MTDEITGSILIVDDNPTNMAVLVEYLTCQGYEIHVAEDGESALESLEFIHPELILLDIMMPRVDGFETCRRLKADPAYSDIPVIFMTSLAEIRDKVKGFEAGAVDYITKPIQHEELLARVNTHISLRNLQRSLVKKNLELQTEITERKKLQAALEHLAITDSLTGIYNRRHFLQVTEVELARSIRYEHAMSILMIDIDKFKHVNDRYGHLVGDQILLNVAERLQCELRIHDVLGRYGGEEFAILLPETCFSDGHLVAERLRIAVADEPFRSEVGAINITISLGLSCMEGERGITVEKLLDEADQALYAAKHDGRNCTRLYKPLNDIDAA
jgi:diguanylate cyclase (GGDEF)-like protein